VGGGGVLATPTTLQDRVVGLNALRLEEFRRWH
jgi:hypothetical protein